MGGEGGGVWRGFGAVGLCVCELMYGREKLEERQNLRRV